MFLKLISVAAGAVSITLAGCATSATDVRNLQGDHKTSFVVDRPYQQVYRVLLERQRSCEQSVSILANLSVSGELYSDEKFGTISSAANGPQGAVVNTVIDVRAIDGESATVEIFAKYDVLKQKSKLQQWIAGNQQC
jgi:hypothetical protein